MDLDWVALMQVKELVQECSLWERHWVAGKAEVLVPVLVPALAPVLAWLLLVVRMVEMLVQGLGHEKVIEWGVD